MKTASLLFSAALSASFFPAPAVHAQVPGFTSLVEFTGTSGSKIGYRPMATLLKASDGDFYGTTVRGGTADVGSIFKVTAGGTFTPLRSFTGAAQPTGGIYPVGGLAENSDGFLYGTTSGDYTSTPPSYGIAFKVSANGTTFSNLLFFTGNTTPNKGTQPYASLVRASDGNFYGTTQYGGTGTANYGTIFRLT
ncbi:MAG TPA: choice-of-anchor tandem repeat GloVer-containing protein, partial [Verrucomicrobiales bacterium]|nr:choice-of-anchor tandem repeat GloVer-containing protein [Verrucomicrobiales bacterium]